MADSQEQGGTISQIAYTTGSKNFHIPVSPKVVGGTIDNPGTRLSFE